jgi:hypothetical protein
MDAHPLLLSRKEEEPERAVAKQDGADLPTSRGVYGQFQPVLDGRLDGFVSGLARNHGSEGRSASASKAGRMTSLARR